MMILLKELIFKNQNQKLSNYEKHKKLKIKYGSFLNGHVIRSCHQDMGL